MLELNEFDENVFLKKVECITVCPDNLLIFHMKGGSEVSHTWEFKSTAKLDWWTPERKKKWAELHKNKDTNPSSIKDETMKRLVAEVLGLSEFDEDKMDAAIECASILEHTVTFHFRDGHTESNDYLNRRVGNPWTEERRIKQTKAIRKERRWRKDGEDSNNNSGNTEQVHGSAD